MMQLTPNAYRAILCSPCNGKVVNCNSRTKGDNSPIIQSVFLCLPFLAQRNFALCDSIMTVLFGRLRSVVPFGDIADPFNTVTRYSAKSSDGFTTSNKRYHRMTIQTQPTGQFRPKFNTQQKTNN